MREDHGVEEPDALREPAGGEQREPGEHVHPEEDRGERLRRETPSQVEPVRDERKDDKAARKRVETEEQRELRDRPAGAADTEESPFAFYPRQLYVIRERQEHGEVDEAD